MNRLPVWVVGGLLATLCAFGAPLRPATPKHRPTIKLLNLDDEQSPSHPLSPPPSVTPATNEQPTQTVSAWKHLPRHVVIPGENDKKKEMTPAPQAQKASPRGTQKASHSHAHHQMPAFAQPSPEEMENIFSSLRDVFSMADLDDDDEADDDDGNPFLTLFGG